MEIEVIFRCVSCCSTFHVKQWNKQLKYFDCSHDSFWVYLQLSSYLLPSQCNCFLFGNSFLVLSRKLTCFRCMYTHFNPEANGFALGTFYLQLHHLCFQSVFAVIINSFFQLTGIYEAYLGISVQSFTCCNKFETHGYAFCIQLFTSE